MEKLKFILRVILSPLVFLLFMAGGIVIPIYLVTFILGAVAIIAKSIGIRVYETYPEILELTFMFILYPYLASKAFIQESLNEVL